MKKIIECSLTTLINETTLYVVSTNDIKTGDHFFYHPNGDKSRTRILQAENPINVHDCSTHEKIEATNDLKLDITLIQQKDVDWYFNQFSKENRTKKVYCFPQLWNLKGEKIDHDFKSNPDKVTLKVRKDNTLVLLENNPKKIYTTIGLYPNGSYKSNGVIHEHLESHINYNYDYRPGRVLIVDGELVYNAFGLGMSEDVLRKFMNDLKKKPIIITKDTQPYV